MEYVSSFGFQRFILCAGYLGKIIKDYYDKKPQNLEIVCCLEKKALGTGGAIRNAKRFIRSNPFLVMNGDSFARIDLDKFLGFHFKKNAFFSMALAKGHGYQNSGKVAVNHAHRIVNFSEKKIGSVSGFDSTGIYLMDKAIFSFMNKKKAFSLEYDLFPFLLKERCFGFVQETDLIDFGIPSEFKRAKRLFATGTLLE